MPKVSPIKHHLTTLAGFNEHFDRVVVTNTISIQYILHPQSWALIFPRQLGQKGRSIRGRSHSTAAETTDEEAQATAADLTISSDSGEVRTATAAAAGSKALDCATSSPVGTEPPLAAADYDSSTQESQAKSRRPKNQHPRPKPLPKPQRPKSRTKRQQSPMTLARPQLLRRLQRACSHRAVQQVLLLARSLHL